MWQKFVASGGEFRAGVRALELITDGVGVVGVRTDVGDLRAERTLLADGGFHANKSLGKKYFGSDGYVIRAAMSNVGDALQMALAVDASAVNLNQFYAHIQHREALEDNRLWPQPTLDYIAEGGLVVTLSGERLGVTGTSVMHIAHEIVRSTAPLDTWVILDDVGWQTLAVLDGVGVLRNLGARLEESPTLDELARRIGIAGDSLRDAVDAHNSEAEHRPRRLDSGEGLAHPPVLPVKLESPPFRAVPIVVGITIPLGGILVSGSAQVLRAEQPIPGLYAAGNAMGGLHGGPNHGYAGGWSQAAVFGIVAAEHAAASV
jgi:fumarate reductase flavoprotein subunit